MAELNNDFVIVLSRYGKIVTVYTNRDFDRHKNLNKTIYEKGEINEG
jgi:hypothetical protein